MSPYCDEFGGAILNATIGHYAYASIEPSNDGRVRFISCDRGESVEYESVTELPFDGDLDLLKHIHQYAIRRFNGGEPLALQLTTKLDVPSGSGLGGSSTLVVAVLKAYAEWFNYPLDDYDLAHSSYVIEREDAALLGGRQDQYAAAFGGFNFMEFGSNGRVLVNPLRIRDSVSSELEASLLLFYTGESRGSASIIDEQTKNVTEGNQRAIEAMHQLKREAFRMKEALLRGDFDLLHEVLLASWDAKKQMATSIVSERIESLYKAAREAGAFCARISGAGGGGFMMFLTDPMRKDCVARALLQCERNGAVYGCHFTSVGAQAWKARKA